MTFIWSPFPILLIFYTLHSCTGMWTHFAKKIQWKNSQKLLGNKLPTKARVSNSLFFNIIQHLGFVDSLTGDGWKPWLSAYVNHFKNRKVTRGLRLQFYNLFSTFDNIKINFLIGRKPVIYLLVKSSEAGLRPAATSSMLIPST